MTEKKCTGHTGQGRWINRVSRFWHSNTLALTAVVFLTALFVWTMADGQSFAQGCSQLYDGVLRLHILANSDSESDQQLKLRVRDRVLVLAEDILRQSGDMEEARQRLTEALPRLQQTAAEEIAAQGSRYTVSARLEETEFPTREYDGFALPSGEYLALRVVIGEGAGKNWWGVGLSLIHI